MKKHSPEQIVAIATTFDFSKDLLHVGRKNHARLQK